MVVALGPIAPSGREVATVVIQEGKDLVDAFDALLAASQSRKHHLGAFHLLDFFLRSAVQ